MKLRRGCGCPLLILLIVDLGLVILLFIRLIVGASSEPVQVNPGRPVILLYLAVFVGNLATCAIATIAALRRQPPGESATEAAEGDDLPEQESDSDSEQAD
jgi:hypothetical protein